MKSIIYVFLVVLCRSSCSSCSFYGRRTVLVVVVAAVVLVVPVGAVVLVLLGFTDIKHRHKLFLHLRDIAVMSLRPCSYPGGYFRISMYI